jgi:anti-sigma regulatory factor (Ser/Thr protein kinase)
MAESPLLFIVVEVVPQQRQVSRKLPRCAGESKRKSEHNPGVVLMRASMVGTGKTRLEISLLPVPQAASVARVFIRHQLISLRCADLVEDACQITAELVGNAVKATASADIKAHGCIRLYLGPNAGRPLLEVWDSSPFPPVLKEPDLVSESGRGLHIVKSLTAGFGWYENGGGKTVWALLK